MLSHNVGTLVEKFGLNFKYYSCNNFCNINVISLIQLLLFNYSLRWYINNHLVFGHATWIIIEILITKIDYTFILVLVWNNICFLIVCLFYLIMFISILTEILVYVCLYVVFVLLRFFAVLVHGLVVF